MRFIVFLCMFFLSSSNHLLNAASAEPEEPQDMLTWCAHLVNDCLRRDYAQVFQPQEFAQVVEDVAPARARPLVEEDEAAADAAQADPELYDGDEGIAGAAQVHQALRAESPVYPIVSNSSQAPRPPSPDWSPEGAGEPYCHIGEAAACGDEPISPVGPDLRRALQGYNPGDLDRLKKKIAATTKRCRDLQEEYANILDSKKRKRQSNRVASRRSRAIKTRGGLKNAIFGVRAIKHMKQALAILRIVEQSSEFDGKEAVIEFLKGCLAMVGKKS